MFQYRSCLLYNCGVDKNSVHIMLPDISSHTKSISQMEDNRVYAEPYTEPMISEEQYYLHTDQTNQSTLSTSSLVSSHLGQLTMEESPRHKGIKKGWLVITTVSVVITAILCLVSGTVIGYFAFAHGNTTTCNLSDQGKCIIM